MVEKRALRRRANLKKKKKIQVTFVILRPSLWFEEKTYLTFSRKIGYVIWVPIKNMSTTLISFLGSLSFLPLPSLSLHYLSLEEHKHRYKPTHSSCIAHRFKT